ncbi:MAG: hypothetical protein LBG73_00305 [Spirochaetaceae bacterium]|jgi:hypothetical protein|nr:hypothetical protein [Spirochaetaceae bacterium]
MKVLGIKEIVRKDVPIYYRRFFSGIASIEFLNVAVERRIDFFIETMPTGSKEIIVTIAEPVDYPLVPLIRALKSTIDALDTNGDLPL